MSEQKEETNKAPVKPEQKSEEDRFFEEMINHEIPFDEELNEKYLRMQKEFLRIKQQGITKKSVAAYLNKIFGLMGDKMITIDDLNSLEFVFQSDSLIQLHTRYGEKYCRPYIRLKQTDMQKIALKILGHAGSAGMNISLADGTKLIISSGRPDFEYHELRHSIDLHLDERSGRDRILVEFVGFFGDIVNPHTVKQTTKHYNSSGKLTETEITSRLIKGSIKQIQQALRLPMYREQCGKGLSEKEYDDAVDLIAWHLHNLSKFFNEDKLDRILFHCKTIDDLSRLHVIMLKKRRI